VHRVATLARTVDIRQIMISPVHHPTRNHESPDVVVQIKAQ